MMRESSLRLVATGGFENSNVRPASNSCMLYSAAVWWWCCCIKNSSVKETKNKNKEKRKMLVYVK